MSYNSVIQCELSPHILPQCSCGQKGKEREESAGETGVGDHLQNGAQGLGAASPQLPQSFCVITFPLSGKDFMRGWGWVLGIASTYLDEFQAWLAPHTMSGQTPGPRGYAGLRETHFGGPSQLTIASFLERFFGNLHCFCSPSSPFFGQAASSRWL